MKYKLEEIADIYDSLHQTPSYIENGISMVRVTDLSEGYLNLNKTLKVSEEIYNEFTKKYVPKNNDIIMSRVGTYGVCVLVNTEEKFCLGQNTVIISPKQNKRFLYYYLMSSNVKEQIEGFVTGSTQKTISLKNIKNIIIDLPSDEQQERIANVLDNITQKIELNNQINDHLHEILKTIYKEWFENDEIINNGKFDKLGNYLDIERGLSYKGKFLAAEGTPMINLGNIMPDGVFRLEKNKYYTGDYKEKVTANIGDIVIANTDMTQNREVIGTPVIIPPIYDKQVIFSHHIYGLKNLKLPKMYIFYSLLSTRYNSIVAGSATGTTVLALPKEIIQNYEILIPDSNKLNEFEKIANIIQKRREQIISENIQLEQLRDTLLPKLMNGEIDLDKIEI